MAKQLSLPDESSLPYAQARGQAPVHSPSVPEWCWFALQLLLVCSVQVGEDAIRGNLFLANRDAAESNAHRLINLEKVLHVFVEPAWQSAVIQVHALHGAVSGEFLLAMANVVYGVVHLTMPGMLAAWVYVMRRPCFGEVRNTFLWTNIMALIGYEFLPTAPPRLTDHIVVAGRSYRFVDSMRQVIGDGRLHAVPLAYNAYSAMPSVHIAWAIVVAVTLLRFQRVRVLQVTGILYPLLMLAVVIVTGNHWLLDGVGAAIDVAAAYGIVLIWERYKRRAAPVSTAFKEEIQAA